MAKKRRSAEQFADMIVLSGISACETELAAELRNGTDVG